MLCPWCRRRARFLSRRWTPVARRNGLVPTQSDQLKWFERWRHALRHGQHRTVLAMPTALVNTDLLAEKSLNTLIQVQAHFQRHRSHVRYQHFEQQQIPLGSGIVESACKWLIQR